MDYESTHSGEEIDSAVDLVATKSTVSVSATGTATDTVSYITVDGTEKKLAGGSATPDNTTIENNTSGQLAIKNVPFAKLANQGVANVDKVLTVLSDGSIGVTNRKGVIVVGTLPASGIPNMWYYALDTGRFSIWIE